MSLLKEYERQQSGVQAIETALQLLRDETKTKCAHFQDHDPVLDAYRTQWHRAQFALLSLFLDEIGDLGDTGEDEEGIGEAALPPNQQ